ncbi:hypothetical protein [Streptomyces sp. CA-106110]|uniref:hypothetical protein n=1 Tax=Streptomyces sp. CA-106110 TaxID=3240044 RepID=UPI003D90EDBE
MDTTAPNCDEASRAHHLVPSEPADEAATRASSHAAATSTVTRLIRAAGLHAQEHVMEAAVHTGLMWRCPCKAPNGLDTTTCGFCGKERLWTQDSTPHRYGYGSLLEELRDGLKEWFDERPQSL